MVNKMEIKWEGEISYAHMLSDKDSKCFRLHGHNAKIEVIIFGYPNDKGMIFDYNKISKIINEMDHKMIVQQYNTSYMQKERCKRYYPIVGNHKIYIDFSNDYMKCEPLYYINLTNESDITAEILVEHLIDKLKIYCGNNIKALEVKWWEDSRSYASGIKKFIW